VLVERAFAKAALQFEGVTRKQTDIPYLSHLMSVAALVMEAGGDEVQVAAAFLHDSAEDKGGEAELDRIEFEFGPEVAAIVRDLSDSLVDTTTGQIKEQWGTRKQAYIDHLREAPERSLLVSAADKLHNARCILADYRRDGADVWNRFNEKDPERQLWYYKSLADVFRDRLDSPLTDELLRTVDELDRSTKTAR
jgi:(p)ppGpp synthase/HD superfamily hydrolase